MDYTDPEQVTVHYSEAKQHTYTHDDMRVSFTPSGVFIRAGDRTTYIPDSSYLEIVIEN